MKPKKHLGLDVDTSSKGRNPFSAACTVLDQILDSGLPSDNDEAAVITLLGPLSSSSMVVDSVDSNNKRHLSISSVNGNKSLPLLSNVVTKVSAFHLKKTSKSVADLAADSQTTQPVPTTGYQKVMKISQAATLIELKNLMTGLLDSLHITPEDSAAKSCCKMTSFVHKGNYLLPTQKCTSSCCLSRM